MKTTITNDKNFFSSTEQGCTIRIQVPSLTQPAQDESKKNLKPDRGRARWAKGQGIRWIHLGIFRACPLGATWGKPRCLSKPRVPYVYNGNGNATNPKICFRTSMHLNLKDYSKIGNVKVYNAMFGVSSHCL